MAELNPAHKKLSAVILKEEVTGNPAVGPDGPDVKGSRWSFGIVEYNPRQEGALKLAALTDYATVLVHSNFPRENVHNIVNSVQERRVRLLYVRMDTNAPNFYQKGTELIAAVAEKIDELGYTTGPATAFATPKQGRVLILLMLLGVAAAGTLLLAEIFGQYHKLFWLVLAVALRVWEDSLSSFHSLPPTPLPFGCHDLFFPGGGDTAVKPPAGEENWKQRRAGLCLYHPGAHFSDPAWWSGGVADFAPLTSNSF